MKRKDPLNGYDVLYYTLVDISVPSGPSTNELSFIRDLSKKLDGRISVLIPEPKGDVNLFPNNINYVYIKNNFVHKSIFQFFFLRFHGVHLLRRELKYRFEKKYCLISRVSILDLPLYFILKCLSSIPFFIRHSFVGKYDAFERNSYIRKIVAKIGASINKKITNSADCIDFITNQHLLEFQNNVKDNKSKKIIIKNGVDHELFNNSVNSNTDNCFRDNLILGYCGSYPEKRGAVELVLTLNDAINDGYQAKGFIIGNDNNLSECIKLIEKYKLKDHCKIFGEIPFKDVPSIMANIDIGFSILNLTERGESEQKVRQYLSSNCRVVVTSGSNDFLKDEPFALVVDDTKKSYWKEIKLKFGCELKKEHNNSRLFAIENLSYSAENDKRLSAWRSVIDDYQFP